MELLFDGRLDGEFNGWDGDKKFKFTNGQVWQQLYYKYKYTYRYRPGARIWRKGTEYFLEVECMSEMIRVKKSY